MHEDFLGNVVRVLDEYAAGAAHLTINDRRVLTHQHFECVLISTFCSLNKHLTGVVRRGISQ